MSKKKLRALFYMSENLNPKKGECKDYPTVAEQEQFLYKLSRVGGYEPVAKIIHRGDIGLIKTGKLKEIEEVVRKYNIELFACAATRFLTNKIPETLKLYEFLGNNGVKIHFGDPMLNGCIITIEESDEKEGEELYRPKIVRLFNKAKNKLLGGS